jgi:hypothetical protein
VPDFRASVLELAKAAYHARLVLLIKVSCHGEFPGAPYSRGQHEHHHPYGAPDSRRSRRLLCDPAARHGPSRACETPGLVIWLDTNGKETAGSVFYNLQFTNLSGHTCTLNGFPFITAVSLSGSQLGRRAAFDHTTAPHSVTLKQGATVKAVLQVVDVDNLPPPKCKPVIAAGLRVFPPNQTRAKVVPFPFGACSASGAVFLRVRPVTK